MISSYDRGIGKVCRARMFGNDEQLYDAFHTIAL